MSRSETMFSTGSSEIGITAPATSFGKTDCEVGSIPGHGQGSVEVTPLCMRRTASPANASKQKPTNVPVFRDVPLEAALHQPSATLPNLDAQPATAVKTPSLSPRISPSPCNTIQCVSQHSRRVNAKSRVTIATDWAQPLVPAPWTCNPHPQQFLASLQDSLAPANLIRSAQNPRNSGTTVLQSEYTITSQGSYLHPALMMWSRRTSRTASLPYSETRDTTYTYAKKRQLARSCL